MVAGWKYAGESLSFVWANKLLIVFILLAFLFTFLVSFIFASIFEGKYPEINQDSRPSISKEVDESSVALNKPSKFEDIVLRKDDFGLMLIYYFIISFINTFFGACLAYCTWDVLKNGTSTFKSGFLGATRSVASILLWSVLAATVGVLLKLIERRYKKFGEFISAILGGAWFCASFFTVPIIVVENANPFEALKKSADAFVNNFGDTFLGELRISITALLVWVLTSILIVGIMVYAAHYGYLLAAFLLPCMIIMMCIAFFTTIQNVFITHLYYYATEKQKTGYFGTII